MVQISWESYTNRWPLRVASSWTLGLAVCFLDTINGTPREVALARPSRFSPCYTTHRHRRQYKPHCSFRDDVLAPLHAPLSVMWLNAHVRRCKASLDSPRSCQVEAIALNPRSIACQQIDCFSLSIRRHAAEIDSMHRIICPRTREGACCGIPFRPYSGPIGKACKAKVALVPSKNT